MTVQGKAIVGPILGIVGGALLLIAGLFAFGAVGTIQAYLTLAGLTWADLGLDPMLLNVHAIMTLLWGILGLVGAILAITGKKIGVYLMLVFGIISVVGLFLPIGTYTLLIPINITLNGSFILVDPFLLLVGGILGLTLKAEDLK